MIGDYNIFIDLYYKGDYFNYFNSQGVLPNKGDIIVLDNGTYEVIKRTINYKRTPPTVSLEVERC